MNKNIKFILLVTGIGLFVYGIYLLIMPETSLDLGIVNIETQDNKNAYITIGLGLASIIPAISILFDPTYIDNSDILKSLKVFFGIEENATFGVFVFGITLGVFIFRSAFVFESSTSIDSIVLWNSIILARLASSSAFAFERFSFIDREFCRKGAITRIL